MAQDWNERLTEDEFQELGLGEGCHVAGILMGGVPCWFAWGPFGVALGIFASFWDACGAVAHAKRLRWTKLDRLKMSELARMFTLVRASSLSVFAAFDDPVRVLEAKVGKHRILLLAETDDRLLTVPLLDEQEAREFSREVAKVYQARTPGRQG